MKKSRYDPASGDDGLDDNPRPTNPPTLVYRSGTRSLSAPRAMQRDTDSSSSSSSSSSSEFAGEESLASDFARKPKLPTNTLERDGEEAEVKTMVPVVSIRDYIEGLVKDRDDYKLKSDILLKFVVHFMALTKYAAKHLDEAHYAHVRGEEVSGTKLLKEVLESGQDRQQLKRVRGLAKDIEGNGLSTMLEEDVEEYLAEVEEDLEEYLAKVE